MNVLLHFESLGDQVSLFLPALPWWPGLSSENIDVGPWASLTSAESGLGRGDPGHRSYLRWSRREGVSPGSWQGQ